MEQLNLRHLVDFLILWTSSWKSGLARFYGHMYSSRHPPLHTQPQRAIFYPTADHQDVYFYVNYVNVFAILVVGFLPIRGLPTFIKKLIDGLEEKRNMDGDERKRRDEVKEKGE